jgi:hypothetical protein
MQYEEVGEMKLLFKSKHTSVYGSATSIGSVFYVGPRLLTKKEAVEKLQTIKEDKEQLFTENATELRADKSREKEREKESEEELKRERQIEDDVMLTVEDPIEAEDPVKLLRFPSMDFEGVDWDSMFD